MRAKFGALVIVGGKFVDNILSTSVLYLNSTYMFLSSCLSIRVSSSNCLLFHREQRQLVASYWPECFFQLDDAFPNSFRASPCLGSWFNVQTGRGYASEPKS